MSIKGQALALFRKSDFHPTPVLCCIIPVHEENWSNAISRAERWKVDFVKKFPEFSQAYFFSEETEII